MEPIDWIAIGFGLVGVILTGGAALYQYSQSRGPTTHGDLERLNKTSRRVASLAMAASTSSLFGLILAVIGRSS